MSECEAGERDGARVGSALVEPGMPALSLEALIFCTLALAGAGEGGASAAPQQEQAPSDAALGGLGLDGLLARIGAGVRAPVGPVGERESSEAKRALDELGRRIDGGLALTDEEWRAVLLASGAVGFREHWAASEPFAVWTNPLEWLGNVELCLTPRDPKLAPVVNGERVPCCAFQSSLCRMAQATQVVGSLAPGRQRLVFDVELARGAPRDFDSYTDVPPRSPKLLWRGELALDVDVSSAVDDVLAPATGAAIDIALAAALEIRVGTRVDADGRTVEPKAELFVAPSPGAPLERVALVLDVALRRGECEIPCGRVATRFLSLPIAPAELEAAGEPWLVVVTGRSEGALVQWNAERWYAGSLVLPAAELIERARGR